MHLSLFGIVALHLCYLTPIVPALLMQLFNNKQPALFLFCFSPLFFILRFVFQLSLSVSPCSFCLTPCSTRVGTRSFVVCLLPYEHGCGLWLFVVIVVCRFGWESRGGFGGARINNCIYRERGCIVEL
ncbi:hypothetical protein V8E53_004531 [Lactarius tabidus]